MLLVPEAVTALLVAFPTTLPGYLLGLPYSAAISSAA